MNQSSDKFREAVTQTAGYRNWRVAAGEAMFLFPLQLMMGESSNSGSSAAPKHLRRSCVNMSASALLKLSLVVHLDH